MLLSFVQFEYPGRIGFNDGRYVVRDKAGTSATKRTPDQVMVVKTFGAPHPERRRRQRPRRAKPVDPPPPVPEVPVTRVTVVNSVPFEDEAAARTWMNEIAFDSKERAEKAKAALAVLNRALDALRRHAKDPLINDASFHATLVMRLGYGTGEELADGLWSEARKIPPVPAARHEDLDAQRRAALELGGNDPDEPEDKN